MISDEFTKDISKKVVHELSRVVGRLDQLIGIANRPRESNEQPKNSKAHPHKKTIATVGKAFLALHTPPPTKDAKKPENSRYKALEWCKKLLELIALPFAIGYAVVTYLQWQDLRHNFEASERAWVKAEVTMPSQLEPNALVVVTARNVGKSPALEMFGGVVVELVDADKAPPYPSGESIRQFVARMVFPSDFTSIQSGRIPNNADGSVRPLTEEELRRLTTGKAYLAAFGTLTYSDQFGSHWTRFCVSKGYQTGWKDYPYGRCNNFNTAGDGLTTWAGPG